MDEDVPVGPETAKRIRKIPVRDGKPGQARALLDAIRQQKENSKLSPSAITCRARGHDLGPITLRLRAWDRRGTIGDVFFAGQFEVQARMCLRCHFVDPTSVWDDMETFALDAPDGLDILASARTEFPELPRN